MLTLSRICYNGLIWSSTIWLLIRSLELLLSVEPYGEPEMMLCGILSIAASGSWRKPHNEYLKINEDAGIFQAQNRTGYGMVVRNHAANLVAARALIIHGVYEANLAEAMAVREALSWIKHMNWSRVSIDMDSLGVCVALTSDNLSFGLIIDGCKHVVANIHDAAFTCIRRSTNHCAHMLARASVSLSRPMS
ncbi:conserved hypothetical protein [Ricinus communis]|uniref:RNase H type-1 domain-containing protein n=1 Tax=Ricinus communis TaxID=3988 RepID=B9SIV2_RICCO|nr:conserved hypothetical protein [Ricinus communis]